MDLINIYTPRMMLQALRQVAAPRSFLMDTFFGQTITHTTKTVDLDIFKGKRRVAGYVNPILDVFFNDPATTEIYTFKPAYTKEKVPTRVADTQSRAMGEDPYNASTPQQRAAQLLGQDLAMLNERVARLEEKMCAEALFTGQVIVKGDGYNDLVKFGYTAGENIKMLSGASTWDTPTGDPMKDIDAWRREIVQRCGIQPTHCILGYKAAWAIMDNPQVRARLTNTINQQFGFIAPENLPEGVSNFGVLQLPSGFVRLMSYDEWYTDPVTGDDVPLVPEDAVLLASTNARSSMNYGLIQNMFSLQASARFPYAWGEEDGSARWVQLEAAPMPNLYQVDAYTVAHVLS
jgi:hypothetical protein